MKNNIDGYVVRNGTGKLVLHTNFPTRKPESLLSDEELTKEKLPNGQAKARVWYPRQWYSTGKEISFAKLPFSTELFDDLKWEDNPIHVRLTIERLPQF